MLPVFKKKHLLGDCPCGERLAESSLFCLMIKIKQKGPQQDQDLS